MKLSFIISKTDARIFYLVMIIINHTTFRKIIFHGIQTGKMTACSTNIWAHRYLYSESCDF